MNMKKLILHLTVLSAFVVGGISCSSPAPEKRSMTLPETVTLSGETLVNKIKGVWAGQVIGCTYSGVYVVYALTFMSNDIFTNKTVPV
jgi:hypothetical protein